MLNIQEKERGVVVYAADIKKSNDMENGILAAKCMWSVMLLKCNIVFYSLPLNFSQMV